MAAEWFCRISGEVTGPFSVHQLKELAQTGRLAPRDQVRHGSDGSWTPADRVKGLFLSAGAVRSEPDLPVAQPLKPAAIRTAEPLAMPAAHPASPPPTASSLHVAKTPVTGPPAATPNPFEIHADSQRPIARATGAVRRKKNRQPVFLVVGSIVVLALCLVVVVVMMDPSMNGPAEDPESSTGNRSLAKIHETAVEPSPIEPAEAPSDETPSEPQEEEIKWLPANQPIRVENVSIEIVSAKIGPARFVTESGEIRQLGQDYLLITIGLQNVDENDELKYTSWSVKGPTSEGMALSDAQGKRYGTVRFSSARIEGQLEEETLAPSTSLEDVLAFQAPVDLTESLRLRLPCAAFGEEGSLYIEIPAEMIRVAEGSADGGERFGRLEEMDLGIRSTEGDGRHFDGRDRERHSATPVSDPYGEDDDPDGDVSQIFRDIDELGGGEKDTVERRFEEDGRFE